MAPIDKVQLEAKTRWENAGRIGTIAGATGTGKTKIALDRIKELYAIHGEELNVLVAVPTEKLRDENWPEDARRWGLEQEYSCVTGVCYVSLPKISPQHFHLIVLDEGHHITETSASLFENCTYDELLVLTATRPGHSGADRFKRSFLDEKAPVVFTYPVEQAVNDGVVNDFNIHVAYLELDDTIKSIKSGSAKKTFYVTEKKRYEYLDKVLTQRRIALTEKEGELAAMLFLGKDTTQLSRDVEKAKTLHQIAVSARAQFIYNLPSKTKKAKAMLDHIKQNYPGKRTIVFAGSIAQSILICGDHVYNSKSSDEYLTKFKAEEIDYLGVVNAVDEGHNIANLDFGLIAQVSSVGRRLVQRLGRIIRKRPGVVAELFLLVVKGTVDEKWAESALEEIPESKITRYVNN